MLEILRIIADWLEDGTHGVNAMLGSVTTDGGDPVPPVVTDVFDETRHAIVSTDEFPLTLPDGVALPLLLVTQHREGLFEGVVSQQQLEGTGSFAIIYVGEHDEAHVTNRNGLYTLRAVDQSLSRLFTQAAGSPVRNRNDVHLDAIQQRRQVPISQPIGSGLATRGMQVDVSYRDQLVI